LWKPTKVYWFECRNRKRNMVSCCNCSYLDLEFERLQVFLVFSYSTVLSGSRNKWILSDVDCIHVSLVLPSAATTDFRVGGIDSATGDDTFSDCSSETCTRTFSVCRMKHK
jgi:hypothetical protein